VNRPGGTIARAPIKDIRLAFEPEPQHPRPWLQGHWFEKTGFSSIFRTGENRPPVRPIDPVRVPRGPVPGRPSPFGRPARHRPRRIRSTSWLRTTRLVTTPRCVDTAPGGSGRPAGPAVRTDRPDIHDEACVKTGARRLRDFPDIHSASSVLAERHENVCGRSHSIPRRRDAPRRTSGYDLGPALDLDLDSLLRAVLVCPGPESQWRPTRIPHRCYNCI
jgi:hypothetical protein